MARTRLAPSLTTLRSAKSNGTRLLDDCDHRSARMRRLRDLIGMHVSDLGGEDACSAAELSIIRRACAPDPRAWRSLRASSMRRARPASSSWSAISAWPTPFAACSSPWASSVGPRTSRLHPLDYAREFDRRKAEEVAP